MRTNPLIYALLPPILSPPLNPTNILKWQNEARQMNHCIGVYMYCNKVHQLTPSLHSTLSLSPTSTTSNPTLFHFPGHYTASLPVTNSAFLPLCTRNYPTARSCWLPGPLHLSLGAGFRPVSRLTWRVPSSTIKVSVLKRRRHVHGKEGRG